MQHLSVVIAQQDQAVADRLETAFRGRFRHVAVAHSSADIREVITNTRANAAIVDLEMVNNEQLRRLCHDCDSTAIVATHRSPDEEMWVACLEVGAADCCDRFDVDGMLRAISNNTMHTHLARAA
jgi:DNA-binding response OmpR family regulator